MDDHFSLPEELLLLALDGRTGKDRGGAALPFGLAAAALADLALRGRLRLHEEVVVVADPAPTGNALLDEAAALVVAEAKPKKPALWVGHLARKLGKVRDRVAVPLVERRVLSERHEKMLGLFPVTRYPHRNRATERDLHERIRRTVAGSLRADERTALLIVLMDTCGLTRTVFEGASAGAAKERANSFVSAETCPRPARDLVAAVFKGLHEQLEQSRNKR